MGIMGVLTVIFAMVSIASIGVIGISPAFAGFVSIPPQPGAMYVVTGNFDNTNVDGGALGLVDFPGTGDLTQIGVEIASQVDRRSLSGMAFDSFGQLFVVAQGSVSLGPQEPILLKINPSTGAIMSNIGIITDSSRSVDRVRDLAMHNNVLYGVGTIQNEGSNQALFIIDTDNAQATTIFTDRRLGGLAITPDGTFYATAPFCGDLFTLNPTNGDTTFVTTLDTCMDGLGADAAGNLYGTEQGPDSVHLIDISDGSDVTVGAVGDNPSDVDFFPNQIAVGGTFIPIDTTALLLAGIQTNALWIMSTLAIIGSVAFGAVYITVKRN